MCYCKISFIVFVPGGHGRSALAYDCDHAVAVIVAGAAIAANGLLDGDGLGAVVQCCGFCCLRFLTVELNIKRLMIKQY